MTNDTETTGVRWQREMEEHLRDVRALTSEAMLPGIDAQQATFRAQLAHANATAALALAIGLAGGDIEVQLSRLAETTIFDSREEHHA